MGEFAKGGIIGGPFFFKQHQFIYVYTDEIRIEVIQYPSHAVVEVMDYEYDLLYRVIYDWLGEPPIVKKEYLFGFAYFREDDELTLS